RPRPAPPGPGPGHRHGLRGARPRRSEAGTRGRRHGHTQHRTDPESMTPEIIAEKLARVREEVAARVVGQDEVIDQALVTFLARARASALDTRFARIQFTPDLMPADVTGTTVLRDGGRTTEFRPGPIFTDLLLADEINRAPAKTQAALLEAMQERQVTVDGESRPLGPLFTVYATQNPVEYEGTYPLPEAQLDRFLLKIRVDYPPHDAELTRLDNYSRGF